MARVRVTPKDDGTVVDAITAEKRVAYFDPDRVDATTEADIARQEAADNEATRHGAAVYARRVRKRTGLTQAALAARIGVPVDTVRNWEQGKRCPAGPAKALLRVLDRAPETALAALE